MEEYMQKMEEIKKRYKEIEEIHAAELKKIQERHSGNITTWNKTNGNSSAMRNPILQSLTESDAEKFIKDFLRLAPGRM
ncbi:GTPase IMAP family member 7-like protein [Labeo rohita]|uniref:GTPase IMAP family member 7-like protein n=1 Tax=Labeo rohita TaxID=84645 RepID=A0A498NZF1_LABRO|nr:GTPase IMAP family member 7-like protein [Labeo rohita]